MYYLVSLLYWITWPVRQLMFWWPERNLNFAIWITFRSVAKTRYLMAQAKHETENFTSNLYQNHKNAFGMGYSSWAKGMGLSPYYSPLTGEPTDRGSYKSLIQSVYDAYHRAYKRYPQTGFALDQTQEGLDYPDSYVNRVSTALKNSGYYTAPLISYNSAVRANYVSNKANWVWCLVNIFGTGFLLVYVFNAIRRYSRY